MENTILNKKHKYILANILFLFCIAGTFYEVKQLMDIREELFQEHLQEIIPEEESVDFSHLIIDDKSITSEKEINLMQFPLWYEGLWNVMNAVLYLFLGGLIYAKNNAFVEN